MLHYLYGEDTYGARLRIADIAGESKVQWVDKQALTGFPIKQWLDRASGSLFGGIVIVAQDPATYPQEQQADIVDLLDSLQAAAVPIVLWDRVSPDKRSKLFRALKTFGQEFLALDSEKLQRWLLEEAGRRGVDIENQAAPLLVQTLGADRWRLSSELDRLGLLGISITPQVVTEHVIATQVDTQIFAFLDFLISGNQQKVVQALDDFWAAGESEFYILSMLAYQFKTILMIRQQQDQGVSQGEVARVAQLNPYVVKKTWSTAQRISAAECLQVLSRILATDFTVKQGKIDARTATTMLTLALVRERSVKRVAT